MAALIILYFVLIIQVVRRFAQIKAGDKVAQ